MNGFLLDEHLPKWWPTAIVQFQAQLTIWRINDGSAPPDGTADPDILVWCENRGAILLTNNRATMPTHLADHILLGRHIPGIFLIRPDLDIQVLATSLAYIAGAMQPGEFDDQILYPPLIVP